MRNTPTTFAWAVLVFQNKAARTRWPLPFGSRGKVTEWADTYCTSGVKGVRLGTMLPQPPIDLRYGPMTRLDASRSIQGKLQYHASAPLHTPDAGYNNIVAANSQPANAAIALPLDHNAPLSVRLRATPARAWQLLLIPTSLLDALALLHSPSRYSALHPLRKCLLSGLTQIWSATEYIACLPTRPAAPAEGPRSKTARIAASFHRITSLLATNPIAAGRAAPPPP